MTSPLDNPIWHSLQTHHAALGRANARAACYEPNVAPFAAVASDGERDAQALRALLDSDDLYYLVGVAPAAIPDRAVDDLGVIHQMLCETRPTLPAGPPYLALDERHTEDMLALTAMVFPGYFRAATPRMGRYFGIYRDGQLAALAGERMHLPGFREISAVCTHPQHTGQGYAQRLVAAVTNDIVDDGLVPFLHVSTNNVRAKAVYERLGFVTRVDIALHAVRPLDAPQGAH